MDDGLREIMPARTKTWPRIALAVGALAGVGYAYWKLAVPEHRVEIRSELVMLGDLDGDRRWTAGDLEALDAFVRDPFAASDALAWNVDLNWNGLIDDEDVCVLRALVAARGNPYAAEEVARERRESFPRPRELYRYAWIKAIPREVLPGSLALDNFLLPGNMEDGADKSRHWNVFGGICLYKSPGEALDLALKREVKDLRHDGYSAEGMREFFRDMIANVNGMYHVMTVNPGLLGRAPSR